LEPDQERISPQWLARRLRKRGHLTQGDVLSIDVVARHKHHYSLVVTYWPDAPGALPQNLVLKWYSDGYPYGLREALFYDQIAPAMPAPPVPPCYDVGMDWEKGHAHVLMQDLTATHEVPWPPYERLDGEVFEWAMEAHLEFHARWWEKPRVGQKDMLRVSGLGVAHEAISPEAIRENQRYFAQEALPARADQLGEQFPKEWRELCERVIAAWADLFIQRMAGGKALTLIQGDAQLGNVMLPLDPLSGRLVLIDWEGCTRGLGTWDLARTWVHAGLPSEMRRELELALLPRYRAQLAQRGIQDYELEDCFADYRLAILANIPHALAWESHSYLESAMRAFEDWECEDLLT
jgi:hypothetical protein